MTSQLHVAIVGFGASGIVVFRNLVEYFADKDFKLIIDIFDKNIPLTKGIAYSTKDPSHILNVEAEKMSAEIEDPNSFLNWLKENDYGYTAGDFAPRILYGLYLEDIIAKTCDIADSKKIRYRLHHCQVSEISRTKNKFLIEKNLYDTCVLATGIDLKNPQKNFWHCNLNDFLSEPEIHIAGSGLTAIDAIVSIFNHNYQGVIFSHSRSGLVTHKRIDYNKKVLSPITLGDTSLDLSEIFHKFVKACRNSENWQAVIDSVRLITPEFWQKLSVEKKKRFIRHCLKYWNIHRHRCPAEQFKKIEWLVENKKLFFTTEKLPQKFIDCTGFDFRFQSELVKNMEQNGLLDYDFLDMGIISNHPTLHLIGGLNFGTLLETTAMPEITKQADKIAKEILEI